MEKSSVHVKLAWHPGSEDGGLNDALHDILDHDEYNPEYDPIPREEWEQEQLEDLFAENNPPSNVNAQAWVKVLDLFETEEYKVCFLTYICL